MASFKSIHINDLGNELFNILLRISVLQDRSHRDMLLHNWPANVPIMTISRSNSAITDLSYIIDTVASWGRLENGDWALGVLAERVLLLAKGTEPGSKVEAWLSKLDTISPDDHYQQPPLGPWARTLPRIIWQFWPVWLVVVATLGFIVPILWPTAILIDEITRYVAAGMVITLLLTMVGISLDLIIMPFQWWVRRLEISIYGPTMGFILGVINSFLWLRSFDFVYTDVEQICLKYQSLGEANLIDYLSLLITSLILSLVVTVTIFLILPSFGKLASRLHQRYIIGLFSGYLGLSGVLVFLVIILPFGWLATIGLMEVPSFCPIF